MRPWPAAWRGSTAKRCWSSATAKAAAPRSASSATSACPTPKAIARRCAPCSIAEKFSRPVFSFIDLPGAYPGLGAEERGQAEAIARNILEMSRLRVPTISVISGEGGSGGALALAVSDRVLILENALYFVITPESCAAIMWRDANQKQLAAEAMRISAPGGGRSWAAWTRSSASRPAARTPTTRPAQACWPARSPGIWRSSRPFPSMNWSPSARRSSAISRSSIRKVRNCPPAGRSWSDQNAHCGPTGLRTLRHKEVARMGHGSF